MKRFICGLSLLVLAVTAQAQSMNSTTNLISQGHRRPIRSNMEMFVIGSGGVSRMSVNHIQNVELRNRDVYSGGLLIEAGRFSFTGQTGLIYFQEGVNATMESSTGGTRVTATDIGELSYIGVPLMGRWNFVRKGRSRLSIGIGLMPAALVSHKTKETIETYQGSVMTSSVDREVPDVDKLRKVNVMALASIGGDIGLGRTEDMRLELLYRRSVMPLGEQAENGSYSNTVQMNIGLGFDI